jgi:parallel beta-helix repeat protein
LSTKPVISQFSEVASLLVHEYERYLPTAFDESLSLLEKVNKVIRKLGEIGLITNDLIKQWNEVMEWVLGDGLNESVQERLDEMVADGTFDTIINLNIFNDLKERMNDYGANLKDYNTLQELFDNVLTTKTVVVPAGDYEIGSTLSFKTGKRYLGYGVTLKALFNTSYMIASDVDDVILEGFTFDGNNLLMRAFHVLDCSNIKLVNCTFKNSTKYGLHVEASSKIEIDSCVFENSGRNDFMSSSCAINGIDIVVKNSKANGNLLGNGFMAYGDTGKSCARVSFVSCEAMGNKQHGFVTNSLNGSANLVADMKYMDCKANNNGNAKVYSGFALHYAYQCIIQNCTAFANQEHGIVLMDGSLYEVLGCNVRSNLLSGIRLQADWSRAEDGNSGVKNSILSNNLLSSNGTYATKTAGNEHLHNGILIEGNCHYIDVINNQLLSNDGRSVFIKSIGGYTDCTNIYINDNLFTGNTQGDDVIKTVATSSIYGINRIAGALKSIRAQESQPLFENINLSTLVASGGTLTNLRVKPNALYRALTGETFTITGLDTSDCPTGSSFFVIFASNSSSGGITINAGTGGLTLPDTMTSFVVNKTVDRHERIYEFIKVSGSNFRLRV